MRTKDIDHIHSILRHDDIWPFIVNDENLGPDAIDAKPLVENDNVYLLSPSPQSLFYAIPENSVTWQIHAAILKPERKRGTELGRAAARWMFTSTPCLKLESKIPVNFNNVFEYALRVGFSVEGLSRGSVLYHGELYDQHLMGLQRKDAKWAIS